jgi:hypothetical protein
MDYAFVMACALLGGCGVFVVLTAWEYYGRPNFLKGDDDPDKYL